MQKNFALTEFLLEISECFCTLSSKIVENTRILDLAQNLHLYKGKAG